MANHIDPHKYLQEHVSYSLGMVASAAREIANETDQTKRNMAIESFANNARAVVEFFYGSSEGNAMVAGLCFRDPMTWKQNRPKKPKVFEVVREQAGKQIAHLTTARTDDPQRKNWDVRAIVCEVDAVAREFFALYEGEGYQASAKKKLEALFEKTRKETREALDRSSATSGNVTTNPFLSTPPKP